MDTGVICSNVLDGENQQLLQAFDGIGCKACLIEAADIAVNVGFPHRFTHWREGIEDINTFLIRGLGLSTLNKSFFRMDVLHAMERGGITLVNGARATENALDKCLTSAILNGNGIPTPRTVIAEHVKHAMRAFDKLGGDVLVKPIYGSQGAGIFRLRDQGHAERMFLEMAQAGMIFYIQEFHPAGNPGDLELPDDLAWDARVLVIDGTVIAAMIRHAMDANTWKANIHAGAAAIPRKPSEEEINLAVEAAGALGLEIAGVDLLFSAREQAWMVLEVNCCPGWTGLSRVSRANIPGAIASHIAGKHRR